MDMIDLVTALTWLSMDRFLSRVRVIDSRTKQHVRVRLIPLSGIGQDGYYIHSIVHIMHTRVATEGLWVAAPLLRAVPPR